MVMGCSSGLSSAGLGTILVYVVSSSNGLMQIQQGYSSPPIERGKSRIIAK